MIEVMIVDDQRPTRMGLALMVGKDSTLRATLQAGNGREAIDLLAALTGQGRPLPDVILMDVRMPVMDGLDATEQIKHAYPAIHILILTTYDQDSYAFAGLGAGASGFLLKDVTTKDLHRAIHAVDAGDAILTPRITGELVRRSIHSIVADTEKMALRRRFDTLGPREFQIAELVSQGLTNAEIAAHLDMNIEAVKKAVSRALAKLGARERVSIAVNWYKADMPRHRRD